MDGLNDKTYNLTAKNKEKDRLIVVSSFCGTFVHLSRGTFLDTCSPFVSSIGLSFLFQCPIVIGTVQ